MVAICVFLFGYTTLIGWAYYGEQFLEYWLGHRVVMPYRWIYCLLIPFGALAKVGGNEDRFGKHGKTQSFHEPGQGSGRTS